MGRGLGQGSGAVGWCYVCVRCESGFSVYMAGPGICVLCLADTCTSEVHPVFNPVAPYGYLLSDMYLFMAGVCSPYVISLSDFAYYVFGQEPAVAVHLALWYVLLVCHQYDVCENSVGSVYVGGYGGLSESGLCVFCKLCPVCFLVVGKSPSVLL